jgi:hypothetical protein
LLYDARDHSEVGMPDLAYVVVTLVFFAVAWGYALACDRV